MAHRDIRLRHKATGIEVNMRDEKGQHKNRAKARRVLLTLMTLPMLVTAGRSGPWASPRGARRACTT